MTAPTPEENDSRSLASEDEQLDISLEIFKAMHLNRDSDPDAYEKAVNNLHGRILRFLIKKGLPLEDAEDAAQECMLELPKLLQRFEGRCGASFTTYLFQAAFNIGRRQFKDTQRSTVRGPGRSNDSASVDQSEQKQTNQTQSPAAYAISKRFAELVTRFMRTTEAHLDCLMDSLNQLMDEDPVGFQIVETTIFKCQAMHEAVAELSISPQKGYILRRVAYDRLRFLISQRSLR